MTYHFIDPNKISDMLYDDPEYIIEFCEAGILSFEEFSENFRNHLTGRNMEGLRKAGHKIKPGAQMMGVNIVVEEYEKAKTLLRNGADNEKLVESADKMKEICTAIQNELSKLAKNHN
jgi:hypothetical protein